MLRNRQHFGQAQGTPFTIPPLQELFDWNASTEAAEDLLEGKFHAVTTDEAQVYELLQVCAAVAPKDTVPAEFL